MTQYRSKRVYQLKEVRCSWKKKALGIPEQQAQTRSVPCVQELENTKREEEEEEEV